MCCSTMSMIRFSICMIIRGRNDLCTIDLWVIGYYRILISVWGGEGMDGDGSEFEE